MALIRAGDLNRRVTILAAAPSTDDGFTTAPGEMDAVGQRWSAKQDVSDRERIAAAQQGSEVTTRFLMRSDTLTRGITAAFQIQCEGASYTISAVKEVGRREGIEITAARRDDGGM